MQTIIANPELYIKSLKARGHLTPEEFINTFCAKYKEWIKTNCEYEQFGKEINKKGKEIGRTAEAESVNKLKSLKQKRAEVKKISQQMYIELTIYFAKIGNIVEPGPKTEPITIHVYFSKSAVNNHNLNHVEILKKLNGCDYLRGIKVAGNNGYFLTGTGFTLQQSILNYAMSFAVKQGFWPIMVPSYSKMRYNEPHHYNTENNEYQLIKGPEENIMNMYANEVNLKVPKLYVAKGTCFNSIKEHGSLWKPIFATHQYEKVELVAFCAPEESNGYLHRLLRSCQDFYESLDISYRIVQVPTARLNLLAAQRYDLEAWFPSLGRYMSIVSCTNFTDYMSRKNKIKYNNTTYPHIVSATLCHSTRALCAFLENKCDGAGIVIPKVFEFNDYIPFA